MTHEQAELLDVLTLLARLNREALELQREVESTRRAMAREVEARIDAEKLVEYYKERDDQRRELDEKLIAWCVRQEALCDLARLVGTGLEAIPWNEWNTFLDEVRGLVAAVLAMNDPVKTRPSSATAEA